MDLKILILSLLAFNLANAEYVSYKNYKVYGIVPENKYELNIVKTMNAQAKYEFWTYVIKENYESRIMVTPEKQKVFEEYLKSVKINYKIVIDDMQKVIDAQMKRPAANRINNDYSWNYYQSLEEIHEWLRNVQQTYPDIVTLVNIGASIEGRDILGVKIDFKKQANATIGMLEGGIHAREWISPATLTWIIKEFLTSTDPDVRALAENIVWHIFPVANPDGYSYTFTNNRMWRKNRNTASFTSCAAWNLADDLSNGVDLNRNFGFMWMTAGASSNPCSETYAGVAANSELETVAIINYVNSLKQEGNLIYYLAFHSYSQMVLVPYSHVSGADVLQAPNYADMYEIAIKGMEKLKEKHGTQYTVGTSAEILYEVSGASFDWVSGVADIPIVYLFELRDVGQYGFLLPPEFIIDNNEEMMDGLLEIDRVTRQIGYYTRSGADKFNISISVFLTSLLIAFNAM